MVHAILPQAAVATFVPALMNIVGSPSRRPPLLSVIGVARPVREAQDFYTDLDLQLFLADRRRGPLPARHIPMARLADYLTAATAARPLQMADTTTAHRDLYEITKYLRRQAVCSTASA